jgi:hypothetical protein
MVCAAGSWLGQVGFTAAYVMKRTLNVEPGRAGTRPSKPRKRDAKNPNPGIPHPVIASQL